MHGWLCIDTSRTPVLCSIGDAMKLIHLYSTAVCIVLAGDVASPASITASVAERVGALALLGIPGSIPGSGRRKVGH